MEHAMQVTDVMTNGVEVADPNATILDVARTMRAADIGALPVGENDHLIGMITDRDIVVRAIAEERLPAETLVRDVMSKRILCCFADDDIEQAAQIMADEQVRRLPVLSVDKRLVCMIALAGLCLDEGEAADAAIRGVSLPDGELR